MALRIDHVCLGCGGTFRASDMSRAKDRPTMFCLACAGTILLHERQRLTQLHLNRYVRVTCLGCRRQFLGKDMARVSNGAGVCVACHEATQDAAVSNDNKVCKVCGIGAGHWRCRKCTSRGHIMGRGRVRKELCGWCEEDELKVG
jgi:hypothetical protein